MDDTDRHDFSAAGVAASVMAQGAELCVLRDGAGHDYLWDAGPAWPRHSPVLFPIIGRLRDDTLLHHDQSYRMTQHGLARDCRFTWLARTADGCVLVLEDTPATRAIYPFPFRFEVRYAIAGATLEITYTAINPGDDVLPASMGAHPAFRWPLLPGMPKQEYALTFAEPETQTLRSLAAGLITPEPRPSPVHGRHLALDDALFAADALIFPSPASRSVRFAATSGPALTVAWEGFEQLGIWSRVGCEFLCIEPWCGMASPAAFTGPFNDKPWLMLIPPGSRRTATHRVTLEP